jgi:hypothetical protein
MSSISNKDDGHMDVKKTVCHLGRCVICANSAGLTLRGMDNTQIAYCIHFASGHGKFFTTTTRLGMMTAARKVNPEEYRTNAEKRLYAVLKGTESVQALLISGSALSDG